MAASPLATPSTPLSPASPPSPAAPTSRQSPESRDLDPRVRARAARRVALLETAETVFAERGFAGATMAEIASRAGYSAGNLYNVFEGKDALFSEVLATRGGQVLELVRKALAGADNLGEIVDRYVDATLELVEKHRGFFLLLTQATPDFDWHGRPGSSSHGTNLRKQLDEGVERVFLQAMDRGEIPRGDPRPYACLLHGTVNAHTARWVRNEGDRDELWGSAAELRCLLRRALGLPTVGS